MKKKVRIMNIKERAAYAWERICSLFKKKEPEIEVEIEEEASEPELYPEVITASSGEDVPATEVLTPAEEEAPSRDALQQTDEPAPSRMTDEYIAWMKAQREAADEKNNRGPLEPEQ